MRRGWRHKQDSSVEISRSLVWGQLSAHCRWSSRGGWWLYSNLPRSKCSKQSSLGTRRVCVMCHRETFAVSTFYQDRSRFIIFCRDGNKTSARYQWLDADMMARLQALPLISLVIKVNLDQWQSICARISSKCGVDLLFQEEAPMLSGMAKMALISNLRTFLALGWLLKLPSPESQDNYVRLQYICHPLTVKSFLR